jgi:hypothetical protein
MQALKKLEIRCVFMENRTCRNVKSGGQHEAHAPRKWFRHDVY